MTQEAPRCQMVVRDALQLAVGGKQTDAARERACGEPLVPTEGPCVMCGRELTSLYHEPSLLMAMGGPGPSGHLFVPLLGCSIHGSDRAPLMAMTATPHPAPDSRPRCGGTPGKPGYVCGADHSDPIYAAPGCYCKGCADCAQPAPIPDAGYAALAEKEGAAGRALGPVDDPNTPLPDPFNATAPTPSGDDDWHEVAEAYALDRAALAATEERQ